MILLLSLFSAFTGATNSPQWKYWSVLGNVFFLSSVKAAFSFLASIFKSQCAYICEWCGVYCWQFKISRIDSLTPLWLRQKTVGFLQENTMGWFVRHCIEISVSKQSSSSSPTPQKSINTDNKWAPYPVGAAWPELERGLILLSLLDFNWKGICLWLNFLSCLSWSQVDQMKCKLKEYFWCAWF